MKRLMVVVCCATFLLAGHSYAGTLRVGPASFSGDRVTVPVLMDGDNQAGVSALDFRLTYDPAVLVPIGATAGPAASDAGKTVQANLTNPGEYKVLMMGMNTDTVGTGEVATITMKVIGEPQNGQSQIAITRTTFASPEGAEVPSEGSTEVLQFGETTGEQPSTDSTQGTGDTSQSPATPDSNATDRNDPSPTPDTSGSETGDSSTQQGSSDTQAPQGRNNTTPTSPESRPNATQSGASPKGDTQQQAAMTPGRSDGQSPSGAATSPPTAASNQQLAKAVSGADAVRSSIVTPGATSSQASVKSGAPSTPGAGSTGTTTSSGAAGTTSSPSASSQAQSVAGAPTTSSGAPAGTAANAPNAAVITTPTTPLDASEAPTGSNAASAASNAQSAAAKSNTTLKIGLLGGVIAIVVGLFFLRGRIFG